MTAGYVVAVARNSVGRPAVVDLGGLMRSHAGGSVVRRKWHDGVSALAPLHTQVKSSGFPGALPEAGIVRGIVDAIAKVRGPLAVVGQPGAIGAIRTWVDAAGRGEGIHLVSAPGRAISENRVFAFLGPAWVERAVETAIDAGARVAVCGLADENEVVEPPPRGWFVADPMAGDGRVGVLSLGTLCAAGLAGVDIVAGLAGAGEMVRVVDGPPGNENPAWSLARAVRLAEVELGRDSVVHVAGNAALVSLAQWAARTQAASAVGGKGNRVVSRTLPAVVQAGDEEWLEALAAGSRNRLLVVWDAGSDPTCDSWMQFALSSGQAAVRVRLSGLDSYALGSATALWLRAVACLALLEERVPVAMGAATAWHASERSLG